MLVRFWVEGYRCFSERTEIDLTDKKNYRFGKECVRGDFLDKMVVLGENNVGKTSFGYAITDIITTAGGFKKDIGQMDPVCFLNKDVDTDKATFHYELTQRGSVITYEYSKTDADHLVSESLTIDRQLVYRYDLNSDSEPFFKKDLMRYPEIPVPDGSRSIILALSERYAIDPDSPVGVVSYFAKHSLYYMAMWKMDVHIGVMDFHDQVCSYLINNDLVSKFENFFRDVSGSDLRLTVEDGTLMVVRGSGKIPFTKSVSRGTMILCRLFCWIMRCKDKDALIYFDDFDDMFHYRTAENAIKAIIAEKRSQCIFVTHNTGLVSNEFLRPDCCFIMEQGQLRSFASLTDKDIRRGHNLEKMLREGEFNRKSVE